MIIIIQHLSLTVHAGRRRVNIRGRGGSRGGRGVLGVRTRPPPFLLWGGGGCKLHKEGQKRPMRAH